MRPAADPVVLTGSQSASARLARAAGWLAIASATLVNPWVARLWRPGGVGGERDLVSAYSVLACILGSLLLAVGAVLRRRTLRTELPARATLLLVSLAAMVLADRLIVACFGLPLWVPDPETLFRHRPGAVRSWGPRYGERPIVINRWGHHDDDFPLAKPAGELRGLVLGDSIAMGHGVTRDETFANRLERGLARSASPFASVQVINTGVQGYSTFQEAVVLTRSLRFEPDFVVLCFYLNDVTEPIVVDRDLGGTGVDYHGVTQSHHHIARWLLNETGFGRVAYWLRRAAIRERVQERWSRLDDRIVAANGHDDPRLAQGWKLVLDSLDAIQDTCRAHGLDLLVVVSPATFQLLKPELQQPERILADHARERGLELLDLTVAFERRLAGADASGPVAHEGLSPDDRAAAVRRWTARIYLDQDHYTPEGHELVAEYLRGWLDGGVLARIAARRGLPVRDAAK